MEPSCSSNGVSTDGMDDYSSTSNDGIRLIEVLDIKLAELRDIHICDASRSSSSPSSSSSNEKSIYCVVMLDREEIFRSSWVTRGQNLFFGDDFHWEVPKNFSQLSFYVYDQIPNRVARPVGRVTFRKQDVVKYSGVDGWYHLKPMKSHSDVTGKICLEVSRLSHNGGGANYAVSGSPDGNVARTDKADMLSVRILDYCDLNLPRSSDLYAQVTLQYADNQMDAHTKKIRLRRKPSAASSSGSNRSTSGTSSSSSGNNETAVFTLRPSNGYSANSPPILRVSVWHDVLGSFSSYFCGEVRVPVDSRFQNEQTQQCAWYVLKPRSNGALSNNNNNNNGDDYHPVGNALASTVSSGGSKDGDLGSLRLKITYTVDHILSTACYNQLWTHLLEALDVQPFRCSVVGLLAALPYADLEQVSKPLIRIFLHSASDYSDYQLRSLIRILCNEEIAQCQDVNTLFRSSSLTSKCIYELMKLIGQQYLVHTLKPCIDKIFNERLSCEIDPERLASSEILEDNQRQLIIYTEEMLGRILDSNHRCPQLLKDIFRILRETTQHYHKDLAVQWLVLSSFLIMRFFSSAILNPKVFGLKRDNPEPVVNRTLALISKLIQRLSNFVVVGHALTEKEPFLTPVFNRFADETHRLSFIKFFDRISCAGGENSITGESVTILKEGILNERAVKKCNKPGSSWNVSPTSSSSCFKLPNVLRRNSSRPRFCCLTEADFCWYKEKGQSVVGRMSLADITVVQTAEELFDNLLVIQIGTERDNMYFEAANQVELGEWIVALQRACKRQRLAQQQLTENWAQMFEIDGPQQLETVHMIFLENAEVMRAWKNNIECGEPLPENIPGFEAYLATTDSSGRKTFCASLDKTLDCVFALEQKHMKYLERIRFGSKEMPIGDDNNYILTSRHPNARLRGRSMLGQSVQATFR